MRRRRGVLLVVLGVVAAGWLAARLARPAPRGASRARLLLNLVGLHAVALPGAGSGGLQYEGPAGPWEQVGTWLTGAYNTVSEAIKRFVHDMVRAAIDGITNVITWVGTVLRNMIGALADVLTWYVTFLINVFHDLFNFAHAAVDWLARAVTDAFNAIAATALRIVAWVLDQIGKVISFLVSKVLEAIAWVWHNVFEPLFADIWGVIRWVAGAFMDGVRAIINAVASVLSAAIDWLKGLLGDLWNLVKGPVMDVVNLIRACWKFLEFVATHPLTWWYDWTRQFMRHGAHAWLGEFTATIESAGSAVDTAIARWLE